MAIVREEICSSPPDVELGSSRRQSRHSRITFLLLCTCYATIQIAVTVHSVSDLALYRHLFCSELYPQDHINFKDGESQDDRCGADSISESVAILTGTLGLFENVPGMLLVLFYGRLSDQYGRRVVFLSLLIGGIVQNFVTLYTAMHFATTGTRFFYLASFLAGISGTNPALRTATWSMITDLIPVEQRLTAFSAITAINYTGMIIGPASGSLLLSYGLLFPLWTSTILLILAIVVLWWLPETLSLTNTNPISGSTASGAKSISAKLWSMIATSLGSLKVLSSSRNAAILGFVAFLWNFTGGVMLIVVQYLNQNFQWTITSGGYFYSIFASLKVFVLLILLPPFSALARNRRWKHVDIKLMTAGLIGDGIAYASYCFMTATTALPVIVLLQAICAPLAVSLRVLISRLADPTSTTTSASQSGQIFAAVSVLEGLGDLAGPAVWNGIYATFLSNGDSGRVVFVIVGAVYISGAVASLFYESSDHEYMVQADDSVEERLLVNDHIQSV